LPKLPKGFINFELHRRHTLGLLNSLAPATMIWYAIVWFVDVVMGCKRRTSLRLAYCILERPVKAVNMQLCQILMDSNMIWCLLSNRARWAAHTRFDDQQDSTDSCWYHGGLHTRREKAINCAKFLYPPASRPTEGDPVGISKYGLVLKN